MKLGLTNGCFDLLHAGHLHLLKEAHKHCDRLVVALNTDRDIERLKGPTRPVDNLSTRIGKLRETGLADIITIFEGNDELRALIMIMKPQVLIKGAEYAPGEIVGWNLVEKTVRVPMLDGWSTTALLKSAIK